MLIFVYKVIYTPIIKLTFCLYQKSTGLSHMTDYGVLVSFPIFDVRSVAPEVLKKGLPKTTVAATDLQDDESEMDSISHILPARKVAGQLNKNTSLFTPINTFSME